MPANKFFSADIRNKLRGKNLGNALSSEVKKNLGAKTDMSAKGKLASKLSGKTASQREKAYDDLGISQVGEKRIEKVITDKHEMTLMEKRQLARKQKAKERRNIFTSRRSAEESYQAGVHHGRTGIEESSEEFAGGRVTSRTRVSFVGRNTASVAPRPGMAQRGISNINGGNKKISNLGGNLGRSGNLNPPGSLGGQSGTRPLGF